MLAEGVPLRHLLPSTLMPRAPPSSATYQSPTTASNEVAGAPRGSPSKPTVFARAPPLDEGAAGVAGGPVRGGTTLGCGSEGRNESGPIGTGAVGRSHAATDNNAIASRRASVLFIVPFSFV